MYILGQLFIDAYQEPNIRSYPQWQACDNEAVFLPCRDSGDECLDQEDGIYDD